MSIRIYALAKELKIESKELVEFCKKLGFDKGSALASLTDEEVELVKKAMSGPARSGGAQGGDAADAAPKRPAGLSPSGRVPVLKPTALKPKPPQSEVASQVASSATTEPTRDDQAGPVDAVASDVKVEVAGDEKPEKKSAKQPGPVTAPVSEPAVVLEEKDAESDRSIRSETPETDDSQGQQRPQEPQTPSDMPTTAIAPSDEATKAPAPKRPNDPTPNVIAHIPHIAAIRREDYVSPMRSILNKVPLLGRRKSKDEPGDKTSTSANGKQGPSIRLAPVPRTQGLKTPKAPQDPTPQKPDMKLPKEAIRAAALGTSRPLDEHIRKHEEKQRNIKEGKDVKDRDKDTKGKAAKKGKLAEKSTFIEEDANNKKKGRGKGKEDRAVVATEVETPSRKRRGSSKRRHAGAEFDFDENATIPRQLRRQKKSHQSSTAAPRKSDLVIQLPCTVKQFAEQTGLSIAAVLRKLIELEMPMIITSQLDADSAGLLGEAFQLKIDVRAAKSLEDEYVLAAFDQQDEPEDLVLRPPVVTFLGHVDHGKTSLLDRILKLDVVSGEKGGITQHIRAYRIKTPKGDITFVDTPGHEAFTEMRARGANCTDIVVLVVAADDGVMPQTEEAISHAKAAGVPIVVALNKCDLPSANRDRALQELAANEILPSEWGGDVEIVQTSAITGAGIDELLETLLTIAELGEIKANPKRPAIGIALEAEMQAGQGVVAKVLVRNGTLHTGDVVICGAAHGRVKVMQETLAPFKKINAATPGTPVQLIGLDVAPAAGSKFCVLDDISVARQIAQQRAVVERNVELADTKPQVTLENLFQRISEATDVQTLNIIIRADVRGSIEAIRKELGKLDHPEVKVRILQASVGGITEADVQLADASEGIIVGFNVVPDEGARMLSEKRKIQIRRYDIIYNLANDIKAALEGMLKPISRNKELGRVLVQRTFVISRTGTIAGCRVLSGTVERDCRIRVIRENRIIGDYSLDTLKREKDDAKEVREGYECGIKLKGYNDIKEGDLFESYKTEEVARTF